VKKNITTFKESQFKQFVSNKSLVLVGGCFDILHPGHTAFLAEAKKLGDLLIVLLESDQAVKERKGNNRPINNSQVRAKNLLGQTSTNIVITLPFPFVDADYDNLVTQIKPAIIATTKGDPYIDHKARQAKKIDAELIEVIDRLEGHSTTNSLR
jgi:cytidyltransferase-like protein